MRHMDALHFSLIIREIDCRRNIMINPEVANIVLHVIGGHESCLRLNKKSKRQLYRPEDSEKDAPS